MNPCTCPSDHVSRSRGIGDPVNCPVHRAVAFAVANVELEGMTVDDGLRALLVRVASGEITVDEALTIRKPA